MNYFIDTEFIEGVQKKRTFSNNKPTIDLISLGIVSEYGDVLYLISKDFNLKEAWNRCDGNDMNGNENYWIRDNVLFPIYNELVSGDQKNIFPFDYKTMKTLIKRHGKTNQEIAEIVKEFIYSKESIVNDGRNISFYGYYADYDWVVFCWLFGRMLDLPNSFPMYCKDLKQILDERCYSNGVNLKDFPDYPSRSNEHNALSDSKWSKELFEFLEKHR